MTKLICLLSMMALTGLALFDKAPDLTTVSIRMGLALIFAVAFLALVREELDTLLDR